MDLQQLRNELIGGQATIKTPYGEKVVTYGDYTASGRSLLFVEEYMLKVAETYANTHTEDCYFGRQTTKLYHEAKERIRQLVHGNDDYIVVSVGSGTTGAIQRLAQILGIYESPATRERFKTTLHNEEANKTKRPIVFVGPYEHHSNELIWKEAKADVIEIGLDQEGLFDVKDLEIQMTKPEYAQRLKIGAFSAASNVTGMYSPIKAITRIMHENHGLVFFDFAACGPYVAIEMIHEDGQYYDGIYLSPHKFIGGPGSSGLLIFRKDIYNTQVGPTCAGGGTVEYVSSIDYDFINDIEKREDAGTPSILQTIRAAAAFEVKESIGVETIEAIEKDYIQRAIHRLVKHPHIEIIGPKTTEERLGILSLSIRYKDNYLHPRYVTTLLNDLFGIQSRAGCSCAGPYGHMLLGISEEKSERYRQIIKNGCEAMKPGWVRVNFHYLLEEFSFEFMLWAIEFIADYGYLFLRDYSVNSFTGNWTHRDSHLEVLDSFSIEKDQLRSGYEHKKYHREATKGAYETIKCEATKLVEVYIEEGHSDALELFEAEAMKDLAWFYVQTTTI
jgi:selenocysteine lyase/cysteine desulfurase